MKSFSLRRSLRRAISFGPHLLLLTFVAMLAGLLFWEAPAAGVAYLGTGLDGAASYLPAMLSVPMPTYPLPQVVAEIPLPGAACPQYVDVNPTTGYAYIANHGSSNVSIVQDSSLLATVHTGEWPSRVSNDPNSARAFVSNMHGVVDETGIHGFISVFDGLTQVTTLAAALEPFDVVYNPVNNLIYSSDPHISQIRVYDGTSYEVITDLEMNAGWVLDLEVDTNSGLTYAGNWEFGRIFTLNGPAVVDEVQAGWGPWELAVDPNRGLLYAAHSAPNATYPNNISVLQDGTVVTYTTAARSWDVAVNPATGYAYVTNQDDDSVTILKDGNVVGTVDSGDSPAYVAVNPNSGYAFVANSDSDTVTVLKDASVVATYPAGSDPHAVAVDSVRNITYVVNRDSHLACNEFGQCPRVCDENPSVTVLK